MSEEIKTNTENEGYDINQRWDDLAENLDWLEDQAKKGNEVAREKAAKYITEVIADMAKVLQEIDEEKSNSEPKTVAESGTVPNEYASAENARGAEEEKKKRVMPDGTTMWLTDSEAADYMRQQRES